MPQSLPAHCDQPCSYRKRAKALSTTPNSVCTLKVNGTGNPLDTLVKSKMLPYLHSASVMPHCRLSAGGLSWRAVVVQLSHTAIQTNVYFLLRLECAAISMTSPVSLRPRGVAGKTRVGIVIPFSKPDHCPPLNTEEAQLVPLAQTHPR